MRALKEKYDTSGIWINKARLKFKFLKNIFLLI